MEPPKDTVNRFIEADAKDLDYVRELAAEHGVTLEVESEDGFDPGSLLEPGTLTLLMMGTSLGVATLSALIDERRGGQVIDLRPNAAPMTRRDRSVVHGLVVVIAMDGEIRVEVKEPRGMLGQVLDLLRDVTTGLVGASQTQAAEALTEALGGRANVMREPAEGAP